jgi:hypothetical protein
MFSPKRRKQCCGQNVEISVLITIQEILFWLKCREKCSSSPLHPHLDSPSSTSRLLATDLHTETLTSNHYKYYTWNFPVTLYILIGRPLVFFCTPGFNSLLQLTTDLNVAAFTSKLPTVKSKWKSYCDWRSVSQSVSLGVKPNLGLMTRYLLLFDSYSLVIVGRPLWRQDGSVFCQSHCLQ